MPEEERNDILSSSLADTEEYLLRMRMEQMPKMMNKVTNDLNTAIKLPKYRIPSREQREVSYNSSFYNEYKNNIEEYMRKTTGNSEYIMEEDPDYDYVGLFANNPYEAVERSNLLFKNSSLPPEFVTANSPYFTRYSLYSGVVDERNNPTGIRGGVFATDPNGEHFQFLLSPDQQARLFALDLKNTEDPNYYTLLRHIGDYARDQRNGNHIVALPSPMWGTWKEGDLKIDEQGFSYNPSDITMDRYKDFWFEPEIGGEWSIDTALKKVIDNQNNYIAGLGNYQEEALNNALMDPVFPSYGPVITNIQRIDHRAQAPEGWDKVYPETVFEEGTQKASNNTTSRVDRNSFLSSPINNISFRRNSNVPIKDTQKKEQTNIDQDMVLNTILSSINDADYPYNSPQIEEILKDVLPNQYKEK